MQLSFVFDIRFKESFKIIREKNIIDRKLNILNENCDKGLVQKIEKSIRDELKTKI